MRIYTLALICIHLLSCINSQWLDIWFEDGSKTTQSEWTESKYTYFDYDGGKYDDACVTDKCILLWGWNGENQWIYRTTDVSIYDTLRLKYDLTAWSFEESDACLISYSYQGLEGQTLAEMIEPINASSSTAHHYTDRYCSFPSAAGENTIHIWLETFDGTSADQDDLCFWDNIYLQGILAPTASPTKSPTKGPTLHPSTEPSKYPTLPPTKHPTDDPTSAPTDAPTTSPTSPTLPPSVSPTQSTQSPSLYPTRSPTLNPSLHPTHNPTLSPTPKPTKPPTVPPTPNPSRHPTLRPSDFPTLSPTNEPTPFPTPPTKSPTVSPTPFPTLAFVDIWFEDGSKTTQSEWTESEWTYFGYDGQKYDDACATDTCIALWGWDGADQWVYRETDISLYDFVQLKYDVTAWSFEASDACQISYAYDTQSAKTLAQKIEPSDTSSSTTHYYRNRYCTFPSAAGKNTMWIWLETFDGTSADQQDVCFWDNIHLQGVFGPTQAPTKNTAHPTKSPTKRTTSPTKKPTKNPTKRPTRRPTPNPTPKPTKNPTKRPTKKPTKNPTKRPTRRPSPNPTPKPTKNPTKTPTRRPSKNPTPKPTKSPTKPPTLNPTEFPTTPNPSKDPTLKPTDFPTISPTLRPSSQPTVYTTNPTDFPTVRPTLNPSDFPTVRPTSNPSVHPITPTTLPPTKSPSRPPPTTSPTTANPTNIPSKTPTIAPTNMPTTPPTNAPTTSQPSEPTDAPSHPTKVPSNDPTNVPTTRPTVMYKPSIKPATEHPMVDIYVYYDYAVTLYTTSTEATVGGRLAGDDSVDPVAMDPVLLGLIVLCCSLCVIVLLALAFGAGYYLRENKMDVTMKYMNSKSKKEVNKTGEKDDVAQFAQEDVKKGKIANPDVELMEGKRVNPDVELMEVVEDSSSSDSLFQMFDDGLQGNTTGCGLGPESMAKAIRFMNNAEEFEPPVKIGGETDRGVIAEGESYSSAGSYHNVTLEDLIIGNDGANDTK